VVSTRSLLEADGLFSFVLFVSFVVFLGLRASGAGIVVETWWCSPGSLSQRELVATGLFLSVCLRTVGNRQTDNPTNRPGRCPFVRRYRAPFAHVAPIPRPGFM
jgi:hypothetical protein